MFGLVGILLALGLIMYLAYRGISVLLLAPVLATLAALFAFDAPLLGLYTQVFMSATGGFIFQVLGAKPPTLVGRVDFSPCFS